MNMITVFLWLALIEFVLVGILMLPAIVNDIKQWRKSKERPVDLRKL